MCPERPGPLHVPVPVATAWRRGVLHQAQSHCLAAPGVRLPKTRLLPSKGRPAVQPQKLLRLYRSEGLGLPRKRPRKRLWQRPRPLLPAERPNERWSIDFVADQLGSGRRFRVLTIMDDYTRAWPTTIVDTSIGGVRVVRALEKFSKTRPLPKAIVSDNGTEFTSGAFLSWAEKRGIELRFIQPGKPNQNAFVESFNGKLRLECLNTHWFSTLEDARHTIETWRADHNDVRPHSSLDDTPPTEFAAAHRETAA
jgi:putative transposase